MAVNSYRWHLLVPAHRYVFALEDGRLLEFNEAGDSPGERFRRYQSLKSRHPVHGMIAWPNTVLLRGPVTAVIDPGILMQGPPLLLALDALGVEPHEIDLVINTHAHSDHTQANVLFPAATTVLHRLEAGPSVPVAERLRYLEGPSGQIAPGLEFLLTPGHSPGSICVLADTEEGVVAVAGDTVGPLPEYYESMSLPEGFPGREELLGSWRALQERRPNLIVPGHNPPMAGPLGAGRERA